jgi:FAD/FMN-containing dehydrogenase
LSAFPDYARAQGPATSTPDVEALLMNGSVVTLPGRDLVDLARALRGPLLLPRDDGYDSARRLFRPAFDRRPAFIVQATGPADVGIAIDFARDNGLLMAVKGGGHNEFGVSAQDSAMMLDLSRISGVRVDPAARRAWVAGATQAGLIDHETAVFGLAVPLGGTFSVGIGGLALGGGYGKLGRRYGLTLDSLKSVDLVGAEGRLHHADAHENSDLFWGLRGGGGNFGVATSLEFELHPVPRRVLAGAVEYSFSDLRDVAGGYSELTAGASDDLYVELGLSARDSSEASRLLLNICYLGDAANYDRLTAQLRKLGKVRRENLKPIAYSTAQGAEAHPNPRTAAADSPRDQFQRAGLLEGFPSTLTSALAHLLQPLPGRRLSMLFLQCGGAIARVPGSATAFPRRTATHDMIFLSEWTKGSDVERREAEYAQQAWGGLQPFTKGFYVNDMAGGVSPAQVAENYSGNFARLARLKARWDPQNLFRLNANIAP